MEVLGFYDEPYVVRVAPPPRRIPRPVVTTAPPMTPATDATSRVASLWETTQIEESALEWWRPQVVARRRLGGSRVRVSTLGALAAAIFLIVLTISSVLSGRSEQVEQTRSTIITEAVALENLLPQLSDVVTALDDPTGPDLATSTEILLSAESTARRLFSAAGSLQEDDSDIRAAAVTGASEVLEVTSRVNRLLAYRLAVDGILQPPALPDAPGSDQLAAVTESVTGWRVEVELALEEITSSALPAHNALLEEWMKGLDAWQARYLDAVRQDDVEGAGAARADLEDQLASLGAALRSELATVSGELLSQLGDATTAIDRLVGD
jgi:hypothetical protein